MKTSVKVDGDTKILQLPLKQTTVNSDISGFLAEVEVSQTYVNEYDTPIEAIYTFPLPEEGSIHEMYMKIGDRIIRGKLQEEEKARETYEQAKEQGKRTSLLEQERPNVFTQSVANVMPGDTIDIVIRYSEILDYEAGKYTTVIPAVVGPRYTPGTPNDKPSQGTGFSEDTDRVPDASKVTPYMMGPNVTSKHELSLNIQLDAGFPISRLNSPSHRIDVERPSTNRAKINLAPGDTVPNKDFVLDYEIQLNEPMVSAQFHRSSLGGYLSLIVQPQTNREDAPISPKDVTFVLDQSGSMSGQRYQTLIDSMKQALNNLNQNDRFRLVLFNNDVTEWDQGPAPATDAKIKAAKKWLNNTSAGGGTELLKALNHGLENNTFGQKDDRVHIMMFATDGQISNEEEILGTLRKKGGNTRAFTLGIGDSPNRYVLEEMASIGRGASEFIQSRSDEDDKLSRFLNKIANPYLVSLELIDPDNVLSDVLPDPLPDLFIEEPLYIVSKYDRASEHPITLRGRLGGEPWEQTLQLDFPEFEHGNKAIGRLWGRKKIQDLMRESYGSPEDDIRTEIINISKEYQVLSDYTSFVAVEEKIVRDPDEELETMPIPAELPKDMRPEGVKDSLVLAEVSMRQSKPGDPVLRVQAPKHARNVIAYMPGFAPQSLEWDSSKQQWETRFILPRSFDDNVYPIQIKTIHRDHSVSWEEVSVRIDGIKPKFDIQYLDSTPEGDTHQLLLETAKMEELAYQPVDGVNIGIDLRRINIVFPDQESRIYTMRDLRKIGTDRYILPVQYNHSQDEPFELIVEVMDWARNRSQKVISIPRQ